MSGEMRNREGKSTAFLLRIFRSLLLLMQLLWRLGIQPGLRSALWLKCLFFCYFRPWTGTHRLWLCFAWPRRCQRYSQSNAEQMQMQIHFCMSPSFFVLSCLHICFFFHHHFPLLSPILTLDQQISPSHALDIIDMVLTYTHLKGKWSDLSFKKSTLCLCLSSAQPSTTLSRGRPGSSCPRLAARFGFFCRWDTKCQLWCGSLIKQPNTLLFFYRHLTNQILSTHWGSITLGMGYLCMCPVLYKQDCCVEMRLDHYHQVQLDYFSWVALIMVQIHKLSKTLCVGVPWHVEFNRLN